MNTEVLSAVESDIFFGHRITMKLQRETERFDAKQRRELGQKRIEPETETKMRKREDEGG